MASELPAMGSEKMLVRLLGLPEINTLSDLAYQSRLSKEMLYRLWKRSQSHYRVFEIPKRSGGGRRTIAQPSRELKAVQRWILRKILGPLRPSSASVGFERGDSVVKNAEPHIGARVLMAMDLEDFFPSVPARRVFVLFRRIGYSTWASSVFTDLCTYDSGLPQGSPASPKLANLVCLRLDRRILGYVGQRGIAYTRYADDMTFSSYSQSALAHASRFIKTIVEDEGFSLNSSKTRIAGPGRRHQTTGLVITDQFVGIGRKKLRMLRSRINDLRNVPRETAPPERISHLKGWLGYTKGVDPRRAEMLESYIETLAERAPGSGVELLLA